MLVRSISEDQLLMLQAAYDTSICCPSDEMTFARVFRRYELLCANRALRVLDVFGAMRLVLAGERLGLYNLAAASASTFSRRMALAIGTAETKFCIESARCDEKLI